MIGGITGIMAEEGAIQADDGTENVTVIRSEMMDPLFEMIAGRSRCVTTVGTTIEEETEEDQEVPDGKRTQM